MAAISDYLEEKYLNMMRGTAFTAPSAVYLALFTAAPSDSGGGTEVSGNAYARQAITFAAASNPAGTMTTSATIDFPTATPSGWGTITHMGIFDASSAGNLLWHGALTASVTINASEFFRMASGNLTLTLA